MFSPDQTLSELALANPAASRVFRKHRLDFCCGGKRPVADACAERGLDAASILAEIAAEARDSSMLDFRALPLAALVEHILLRFHDAHRRELPDLTELARRVERVHSAKPDVPHGLTEHLAHMQSALETHMQKEELVLFPAILNGRRLQLTMPIRVMEAEHDDHALELAELRRLTSNFTPPSHACTSWKALFLRCEQLEADLMAHIHLENHVLFPRVLRGDE